MKPFQSGLKQIEYTKKTILFRYKYKPNPKTKDEQLTLQLINKKIQFGILFVSNS